LEADRVDTRSERSRAEFDLAVIGAGIHGSIAALEASRRGLRVVVLERGDFGGATSWSSLRILHGGIRYLQTMDLARFRSSVRSRSWYVREFGSLVQPLECLMPVYGSGLRRPAFLRIALALNNQLRRLWSSPEELDRIPAGAFLSAEEVVRRFPAVRRQGLRGGLLWFDGFLPQPQRIVMELLRRARAHGATVLNYAEAKGFSAHDGGASVEVAGRAGGSPESIRCRAILNCAGPWAPGLNGIPRPDDSGLTLAFNLLLDRPLGSAVTVAVDPAEGGRTYFLCPRGDATLAGTFHARATSADTQPADQQVDDFLADLGSAIPDYQVTRDDVLRVLAGTLPAADLSSEEPAGRDVWIAPTDSVPVFTLVGTKYTTAPLAARKAVDEVVARCFPDMQDINLEGSEPDPRIVPDWQTFLAQSADSPETAAALLTAIVQDESVTSLDDLLLRRTDWGLEPESYRVAEAAIAELCPDLISDAQGSSPSM
jgi:glycerol-3-phosphate dehydrogenase